MLPARTLVANHDEVAWSPAKRDSLTERQRNDLWACRGVVHHQAGLPRAVFPMLWIAAHLNPHGPRETRHSSGTAESADFPRIIEIAAFPLSL